MQRHTDKSYERSIAARPGKGEFMKCPNCGSDVKYYHDTERTRIVCKKKCNGWKVIEIIERRPTPLAAGLGWTNGRKVEL